MARIQITPFITLFVSCCLATSLYAVESENQTSSNLAATTTLEPSKPEVTAPSTVADSKESKESQLITSKDGHFSVALPPGFKDVEMDQESLETGMGPIKIVNYTASKDDNACIFGSSEYPPQILAMIEGKENDVLEGAQQGVLANMNGKVEKQSDVTVGKYPGRHIYFSAQVDGQTVYGKLQLVLAPPRLFHQMFISNQESELSTADINAYFDSLKILSE